MGLKEQYQEKLETQLKEWKSKIDQLNAKAGKIEESTRLKFEEQMSKLKMQHQVVQTKLQALKESGSGAFEHLKSGVEGAVNEFKKLLDSSDTTKKN
jgi:predicted  nucleic acid-binding Zn-ribbon protein